VATPEELEAIITESVKEGSLDSRDAALFEKVLAFRELHAADAATRRVDVEVIDAGSTCDALRDLVAAGHSRFPVVDDDGEVIGVVHGRVLLEVDRTAWSTTEVRELMSAPVVVAEAAKLTSVLHALRGADAEMGIVIDEYGAFLGLITIEDLAEELIGEIQDESDPEPVGAQNPREQLWLVPGSWRLDEVFDETGVALPAGPYETIAGLILTRLERMASLGDTVRVGEVQLVVVATKGRRITRVAVEAAPPQQHET
jgi:CBS domain containing-hemolysin-like protein